MKNIKKIIAVFISALMVISAMPVEVFAYNQDDYDYYEDLNNGYTYTPIAVLPSDQNAEGQNEYCTWSYDASTKTVYINGENIESSHNAYSATVTSGSGFENCYLGDAPLPLYTEIDDDGTAREQYCTFDFEHLVIGKDTVNFNSHVSGKVYKILKTVEFEEGSVLQTIGKQAFYKCPAQEYDLPDTVTQIGEQAFEYSGVTSFTVPSNVTKLSNYIFAYSSLKSITFNSMLTTVGNYAFSDTNVDKIVLPSTVTSIGDYAFENTLVSSVNLPSNLKRVPRGLFSGCKNVASIDFLPSGVTSVGEDAFGQTGISSLDFTKTNITYIYDYAFGCCEKLESVKLNENTAYFSGFNDCPNLKPVKLTSKITTIGCSAFRNDENITSVIIPPSVSDIYTLAFAGTSITEIDFANANVGAQVCRDCTKLQEVTLPSNIEFIGKEAFYNTAIQSIKIPDSVTTIDRGAFQNTPLTEVSFGTSSNLATIKEKAFADCLKLTSFVFPKNVETVGNGAFLNDVNLQTVVVLSDRNLFYGSNPFYSGDDSTQTYLTEIYGNEYYYDSDIEITYPTGAKSYADTYGITLRPIDDYSDNITVAENCGTWANGTWKYDALAGKFTATGSGELPSSVKASNGKAINLSSFLSDKNLKSVVLFDGITSIAPSTFNGTNIQNLDLSNTKLKSLGDYAFANCQSLLFVALPSTLKTIGVGTFSSTALKTVDVPASVTSIGKSAFGDCTSLWKLKINSPQTTLYCDSSNSANNSFGFDSKGNKLTFRSGSRAQTESFAIVDAPVNSKAFEYAENVGIIAFGDDESADLSGYVDYTYRIKWHYFADSSTLYLEHGYDMQDRYVLKPKEKGVFFTDDGVKLQDLGLKIDNLYFCSGVVEIDYNLDQINPKYVRLASTQTVINGFENCTRLEVVNLPQTATGIDYAAFKNCRSLKKISLGGAKYISDRSFYNCTSLKEIDFGSVTSVGNSAFCNCSGLEEINIPSTVTNVESEAFANCVGVKKITLNGEKRIGRHAFKNMPFCTSITLNREYSDDIAYSSWNSAFFNIGFSTTGIELIIGDDVVCPDFAGLNDVFGNKLKISSIHFGKSCNFVEPPSLPEMTYVDKITVSSDNKNMYVYEGNVYNGTTLVFVNPNTYRPIIKDGTKELASCSFKNSEAVLVGLPDSVTAIDDYAFYNAKELKRVVFGSGFRTIGEHAFDGCSKLLGANIPSKVSSIGSYAFYNCSKLKTVILPTSITKINDGTFQYCDSLKNVVVPRSVVSIGNYALACKNLQNLFVWRITTSLSTNWLGMFPPSKLKIHTLSASKALSYAQDHNMDYKIYSSISSFGDACDAQLESDGQYVNICKDGHGRTEYLTVYEPDCENDGYIIGVCEFCSEILEEIHKPASGHNYILTADIPAGIGTKGVKQYTCTNCHKTYCEYTDPLSPGETSKQYTVSGKIVLETGTPKNNVSPVRRADIVINGKTVASTDDNGTFSLSIETGAYIAQIRYAYGYTRTVGIKVEDEDINFATPIPIVGCDFDKNGKIDISDAEMFSYVMSTSENDVAYLDYCDLNHDGYINAKDRVIMEKFMGTSADTYEYSVITIQK